MSDIIPTPEQAKNISKTTVIDGQSTTSVKVAGITPEDMYAVEMKPLLDYYYNTLHMQIYQLLTPPFEAFHNGYILLNGSQYEKEHFPKWQRLVDYKLATSMNESLFQTIDLISVYFRCQLHNIGIIEEERLPNIQGTFSAEPLNGSNKDNLFFTKAEGAFRLEQGVLNQSSAHPSTGGTSGKTYYKQVSFSARDSHPAYGYRNSWYDIEEVAPISMGVLPYAFIGEYRGEPVEATQFLLVDGKGASQDHDKYRIILANNYGYNAKYMIKK